MDGEGEKLAMHRDRQSDLVTFTSASRERIYRFVGEEPALQVPAASIGPQTSEALRDAGHEVKVEAKESTLDSLVSAVSVPSNPRRIPRSSESGRGLRSSPFVRLGSSSALLRRGIASELVTFKTTGDKKLDQPSPKSGQGSLRTSSRSHSRKTKSIARCTRKDLPTDW
jgi:hypothetical protein